MAIHSDMQGPCPDGFHVPLTTEWQAVYDIWTALGGGSSDGTNFGIALKLPFAGCRRSNSNVDNQGSNGYYWSSSRFNTNGAYYLYFKSNTLYPPNADFRTNGFSVRCFKNSPVVPTSTWTKLYGTSIEAGGIFWSSTDGLISLSSDGSNWITIADKNLGATTVWNNGDTLSETNAGKYYQRGNNYGFPRTGTLTDTSSTQVDASTYGPGNYYSSSTFITMSDRWDTTDNGNLWGGVTQGTWGAPDMKLHGHIGTWHMESYDEYDYSAMQGPCPKGFHVPTPGEFYSLKTIWTTLGGGSNDGTNFGIALKLPFAGSRDRSTSDVKNQGTYGSYITCKAVSPTAKYQYFTSKGIGFSQGGADTTITYAYSIRAFKDYPVKPTSSWTKLYGTSIEAGGIFWSSTDGLISLSSEGTTWITIEDKNLGATTVWNSGDTLSEANCGKYYQWGNNYGFPRTGTVTTSSTQVDATNYGPGNYYNSSTYIIRTAYPRGWDSSGNNDLWGGETGVIHNTGYRPR